MQQYAKKDLVSDLVATHPTESKFTFLLLLVNYFSCDLVSDLINDIQSLRTYDLAIHISTSHSHALSF